MKSRQKYLFFVPITGLQNVLISKQTTQLEKTFQLFKNVRFVATNTAENCPDILSKICDSMAANKGGTIPDVSSKSI